MYMEESNEKKRIIRLEIAEMTGINNRYQPEPYEELVKLGKECYLRWSNQNPSEILELQAARDMFKLAGIDPTKRRPSSEALLRRALKEKGYNSVNKLVDIANWCSLDFLLPICVYDSARITGRLHGRIGKEAEGYIAIDNKYLNLSGRFLISDEEGALGSPIKDSLRTRVSQKTEEAVLLIFAPEYVEEEYLEELMGRFTARVLQYCGGRQEDSYHIRCEI